LLFGERDPREKGGALKGEKKEGRTGEIGEGFDETV